MTPFDEAVQEAQLSGGYLNQGASVTEPIPTSAPRMAEMSATEEAPQLSLKDYTLDAILAPLRGVVSAGGSAYDLVDTLAGDLLPDQEFKKVVFGQYADSVTAPGQIIEGISDFATGFIPGLGLVGRAGKLAKAAKLGALVKAGEFATKPIVKGALAGAVSDFVAFDPHAQRLSNLLQSVDNPLLNNAVTNYLAADENDSQLEGRFKNAVEGLGIGAVVDTLWYGLKAYKARKSAVEAGKPMEEVERITNEAANPEELKKLLPSSDLAPKPSLAETTTLTPDATAQSKAVSPSPAVESQPKVATEGIYTKEQEDSLKGIVKRTADNYIRPESNAAKAERLSGVESDEFNRIVPDQVEEMKKIFNYTTYRDGNDRILMSFMEAAKEKLTLKPMSDQQRYDLASPLARAVGQEPEEFMKRLTAKADAVKDLDITVLTARMAFDSSMNLFKQSIEMAKTGDTKALNDFIEYGAVMADMGLKVRGILSSAGKTLRSGQELKRFLQSVNLNASGLRKGLMGRSISDLTVPGARELVERRIKELGGRDALVRNADRLAMAFESGNIKAVNSLLREGRWMNAHNEFWINSLLSGPKTAMVNAFGNTFTSLYLPLEGAVGAARKGNFALAKEFISRYGYMVEAIQDSYKIAKLAWKTNEPKFISDTFTDPGMNRNAISASNFDDLITNQEGSLANFVNGIGNFVNLPTRFLMSGDEFFKQINARSVSKARLMSEAMDFFADKGLSGEALTQNVGKYVNDRMEILFDQTGSLFNKSKLYQNAYAQGTEAGLKGQALQDFMKDSVDQQWERMGSLGKISEYSEKVAREATFQTDLVPGTMAYGVQKFVAEHPIARLAMPFTRTPINILKFFGQRMGPLDVPGLRNVHKRMVQDLSSGDPRLVAEATGRFWMGSAISFTAAMMGIRGLITGGGPTNEEERKMLESTGWRPYSFRVGDNYVSFQRLDPFATFFGMAADLADASRRMDADENNKIVAGMAGMALALTQNVVNKSYMTGLERFMEAIMSPERFVPKLLKSQLGSYVPSVIAQAVPTIDPYAREARTFMDALLRRTPGMTGYVDKKRNILGEPVELPMGRIPFGVDYLSPMVVSKDKKDKVMMELANLQYGFSMPRANLGGGLDLREISNKKGQTAYDRWLDLHQTTKVNGKTLRQSLTSLVNSTNYKRLSDKSTDKYDSPRIQAVRRIIRKYRDESLKKTLKEFKDLNQNYNTVKRNKISLKKGISVDELMPLK